MIIHKKVNLFYKGKELTNDEQLLGDLLLKNNFPLFWQLKQQ